MLQDDTPEDITGQEIKRLLGDLAGMSGQAPAPRPALELLIGDILTRTSVEPEGADLYLCVTGLLPPGLAQAPVSVILATLDEAEQPECELLWHADLGRHILVRRIALRHFTDERSVMDAILDTADMARRCLDAFEAG